jgi:hypothetical protein
MYNRIPASKNQVKLLLNRHLKPFLGIGKIIKKSFSYDSEDGIGFVTLYTITGKKIEYQLRSERPMFVSFSGFGDIVYDISYPEETSQEMFDLLKKYGDKIENKFWNLI